MALKLRKDVKKSSYYVWFLGAKESKGLRGPEYIQPVIKHLEQRERDVEPFKVTLQVSHKGLKIVQNVQSLQGTNKSSKPKNETIKHFIPHNTITCVYQHEDVIACILLLFNPVTKCPLHVHAYRCDSLETATLLKQQLQTLIERPDNQKKFAEIEGRLKPAPPPQLPPIVKKVESSLGSDTGTSTRESESSEERFVVENSRVTTLYDSVAAELREKLNKNKVPILLPPRDYDTVHRQKGNLTGIELRRCLNANIVGQNAKSGNGRRIIESSGGSSGIGSDHPPSPDSPDAPDSRFNTLDNHSTSDDEDWNGDPAESTLYMMHSPPQVTLPRPARDKSPSDSRYSRNSDKTRRELTKYLEKPMSKYDKYPHHQQNKTLERTRSEETERGRTVDRKETRRVEKPRPVKYFDDDGFDENLRYRTKPDFDRPIRRSYDDDDFFEEIEYREPPVPKIRQKYASEEPKRSYDRREPSFERTSDRPFDRSYDRSRYESPRKSYDLRQRTPSPKIEAVVKTSPRDRFKDAKEKFLSMEKEERRGHRQSEPPISPTLANEKPSFVKRHESMSHERPKPAPRGPIATEEVRYRNDRYRASADKYEPKRRSMFSLIEEEHRKNSNDIARELKRRSYMDADDFVDARMANYSRSAVDLAVESVKKSPGYRHSYAEPKLRLEQNNNNKNKNVNKHYASEMLHRTNSVSNGNGRVGIASVHPY